MSIFLDVMKEELDRNLYKQDAFNKQFISLPKGYLSECMIDNKIYVYRKRREGSKVISEYIGVPGDDNVKQAMKDRQSYIELKKAIKFLKDDERRLRKAIKEYEKL